MFWPTAIIFFALTAAGCTSKPAQSSLETAFGTLDADFPPQGLWPFVGAIVAVWHPEDGPPVVMGAQCTAIKLPGQLILTNAHCTRPASSNTQITLGWTNRYRAVNSDITQLKINQRKNTFEFRGDLAEDSQDIPLLALRSQPLYRHEGVLDYQLLEMTSPSSDDDSYVDLLTDSEAVSPDGPSLLLSHPAGLPLLQSSKCRRILSQGEYLHDCDSLKGSSGGALLSADQGQLVGLHKQGYSHNDPAIFADRGAFEDPSELVARECAALPRTQREECQRTSLATAYNKAVPIARILDDMEKNAGWLLERIRRAQSFHSIH